MKKRQLGKSNLFVNPVGLGCMGFSHAYGTPTEKSEAKKIIREAFDYGYDFFDTAECYTGLNSDGSTSYNEEIVGKALKSVREKVIIATKFGVQHLGTLLKMDSSPETIKKAVEGSLKRLGTDYIDLYYQHRIDPKVSPEDVASVMNELINDGKLRAWGISEADEEYLRRANNICPVTAIQNRYSMMARWHENLFPVLEELNIAFVAFSPMGNGFLSGKYKPSDNFESSDFRSFMPQYTKEGFAKAQEFLRLLEQIAESKNATMGQISMSWMLCKKPYIIPIPGSRKIERIKENFEAGKVLLTQQEINILDEKLNSMKFLIFGGH
ncbi:MAG: aldo/keto reductase [Synergistaceae bacterium]|nr:aldo/keto reductase [Synergistaceae bacterium]